MQTDIVELNKQYKEASLLHDKLNEDIENLENQRSEAFNKIMELMQTAYDQDLEIIYPDELEWKKK